MHTQSAQYQPALNECAFDPAFTLDIFDLELLRSAQYTKLLHCHHTHHLFSTSKPPAIKATPTDRLWLYVYMHSLRRFPAFRFGGWR